MPYNDLALLISLKFLFFLKKFRNLKLFFLAREYSMSLKMMIAQEIMENASSSSKTSLTTKDAFWIR